MNRRAFIRAASGLLIPAALEPVRRAYSFVGGWAEPVLTHHVHDEWVLTHPDQVSFDSFNAAFLRQLERRIDALIHSLERAPYAASPWPFLLKPSEPGRRL